MQPLGLRLVAPAVTAMVLFAGCGSDEGSTAGGESKATPTPTNGVPALLADVPQPVATIAYLLHDELTRLGYPVGRIDTGFTKRVTRALKRFQRAHGIEPTGAMDQETAVALREATGRRQRTVVLASGFASTA